MKKVYSKKDPNKLLHLINRLDEIVDRTNVAPDDQFIQLATLRMDEGKTFKPHKHIHKWRARQVIAQESWIVVQGSVGCTFYDIDNEIIAEPILYSGDASFTLEGGHTYTILEDNTLVYEYKTGPYEGQQLDKVFI